MDYDIDKAYIMGQNYNSRGIYVKWSPLFDYSSLKILEASKKLPIPKGFEVKAVKNTTRNYELTNKVLSELLKVSVINEEGLLIPNSLEESIRVKFIEELGNLLRLVEEDKGEFFTESIGSEKAKNAIIKTLNYHELYQIPKALSEKAYKNVASANIYNVSHDIRNRDQAYTAISMGLMRKAAEQSPKGEQASKLNMLNPLTKYIMQYQNLVGKNVIGIAANGEKFWFNLYYYWTKKLKSGDTKYLSFSQNFSRIKGRGNYLKSGNIEELLEKNVTYIPDLDIRDKRIKDALINEFGLEDPTTEEYHYTDQLISQLLSAATDNAKELILAKINAGTNFAKMYMYLMTLGYDLNDIAAFMVSPAAEFIDTLASVDFFQGIESNGANAITMAEGGIRTDSFLHGTVKTETENNELVDSDKTRIFRNELLTVISQSEPTENNPISIVDFINNSVNVEGFDYKSLSTDELLKYVIQFSIVYPNSNDYKELNSRYDKEFIVLYNQIQRNIENIKKTALKYQKSTQEYFQDVTEFKKIFNLASEMSVVASAYLGLNQGLATDKLSLIKKINSMKKIISDRENIFGIKTHKLFTDSTNESKLLEIEINHKILANKLIENNPNLKGKESEIRSILETAYKADIINNFDPIKMLKDPEYRQIAKDYLEIIKGTVNAIDMIYEIPHYNEILSCLRALVVSDNTLSMKSRLIEELVANDRFLNDKQLRNAIKYVDNLNIVNFLENLPIVKLEKATTGFSPYFDKIKVSHFDLSTLEGISGFKYFIENEFLEYLKSNYPHNTLVKHLVKYENNDKTVLATDIDLLNPDVSAYTKIAYGEIIKGMSLFENIEYNEDYTIADIFQIYNILVNGNQYGGERLTTAFKGTSDPNSVLQKFLKFTADTDAMYERVSQFDKLDFQINAAEIVTPSKVKYMKAPFIKVKDPVWGYVLKRYKKESNIYEDFPLLPSESDQTESFEVNDERKTNFLQNVPIEMPNRFKIAANKAVLVFTEEPTEELQNRLYNSLRNWISSGKIYIIKDC
jgi:hypothetical protein